MGVFSFDLFFFLLNTLKKHIFCNCTYENFEICSIDTLNSGQNTLLLSIALLIPSFALVLTALCVIGSSADFFSR